MCIVVFMEKVYNKMYDFEWFCFFVFVQIELNKVLLLKIKTNAQTLISMNLLSENILNEMKLNIKKSLVL